MARDGVTEMTLKQAVERYFSIMDDLRSFDGDKRGIACALVNQENVLRKLVGLEEIENEY